MGFHYRGSCFHDKALLWQLEIPVVVTEPLLSLCLSSYFFVIFIWVGKPKYYLTLRVGKPIQHPDKRPERGRREVRANPTHDSLDPNIALCLESRPAPDLSCF